MLRPGRHPPGVPSPRRRPARRLPPVFALRGLLAAAGVFTLLQLDPKGVLVLCAWAAIALGVGSELLASLVFVMRRHTR